MITVLKAGPLTTVQDLGRPGFAHLGVPRSGALDQPALRRANRLVGNEPSAAGLETTLMGCRLRFEQPATIAVTGATCTLKIDGHPVGTGTPAIGALVSPNGGSGAGISAAGTSGAVGSAAGAGGVAGGAGVSAGDGALGAAAASGVLAGEIGEVGGGSGPFVVPAGAVVEIGRATAGVRSYLAVAGGLGVEPVLGSRSTDTLSGLGPARLVDGQTIAIGAAAGEPDRSGERGGPGRSSGTREPGRSGEKREPGRPGEMYGPGRPGEPLGVGRAGELVLGVWCGPRDDWVEVAGLFGEAYAISPMSNRVACRLAGTALRRTRAGELPPEGLVLGAIQVPPDGQPLIFLADHPTTGGYPVIGVVDDVTPLAQARPGTSVRFRELD